MPQQRPPWDPAPAWMMARALWAAAAKRRPPCTAAHRHDRLSFGLAAEQARAAGLRVGAVIVGDCCGAEVPGLEGRRGLAGVALVAKVAGAAAAQGRPLDEVRAGYSGGFGGAHVLGVGSPHLSACVR